MPILRVFVYLVNLLEIATGFRSNAKTESSHQRLQRFFRNFDLNYAVIARAVITLIDIRQPWVLSTERTEWSFGEKRFNLLFLGVVHDGIADPIVGTTLEKKVNSNANQRMDLLDRFYELFADAEVAYLTGDREFVGKQWLTYLLIEPMSNFA